jgi:protein gp37
MTRKTAISYADASWPVVTGCSKVGEGCRNCYAAFQAAGRLRHHPHYVGLAGFDSKGVAQWTGKVRCNEDALEEPMKRKKPTTYFVAPRGDLFHEQVPDDFLDKVFDVMGRCPQHRFLVFTKRSERRLEYIVNAHRHIDLEEYSWPLPNVWQITSVWDQESANRLIPPTLYTPAALRGVSIEPLLGPIDLARLTERITEADGTCVQHIDALNGTLSDDENGVIDGAFEPGKEPRLDWVIVGGESGKNARPMHPDWARSLRDQCAEAGVPFYFKQWGEFFPGECLHDKRDFPDREGVPFCVLQTGNQVMYRVGKAKAGHLLDGKEYLGVPK